MFHFCFDFAHFIFMSFISLILFLSFIIFDSNSLVCFHLLVCSISIFRSNLNWVDLIIRRLTILKIRSNSRSLESLEVNFRNCFLACNTVPEATFQIIQKLTIALRKLLRAGLFPSQWCCADIVPISKGDISIYYPDLNQYHLHQSCRRFMSVWSPLAFALLWRPRVSFPGISMLIVTDWELVMQCCT